MSGRAGQRAGGECGVARLRLNADRAVRGVADPGMRPWRLGPPGAEPVLGGLDVAQVVDGRIARLWTVLDS